MKTIKIIYEILFFTVIIGSFLCAIFRDHIRFTVDHFKNRIFNKNKIKVLVSEGESKLIDKKDYHQYEKKDKELRKAIKEHNDWYRNLDKSRFAVNIMFGSQFFAKFGIKGDFISDYVKGKIGSDEYNTGIKEALDSEEYKKRHKPSLQSDEQFEEIKKGILLQIKRKSKEVEKGYNRHLETMRAIKKKKI